jgi:hypothetical protein
LIIFERIRQLSDKKLTNMNIKKDILIILFSVVAVFTIAELAVLPIRMQSCRNIIEVVSSEPTDQFKHTQDIFCDPIRLFGGWDLYKLVTVSR